MFLITLAILLLVCSAVLKLVPTKDEYKNSLNKAAKSLKLVAGLFIVLGVFKSSYYSVPAGNRGILLQFGAVKGVLGEGAHFIAPFVQKVELMDVRTAKETAQAATSSKDLQDVSTTIAVNYHIEPSEVGNLYKTVGVNFASKIIDPATQETVKAVMANYTAKELVQLRSKVKTELDEQLTNRLKAYNIIVEPNGVSLTNFQFSKEFNDVIESSQVAQQLAIKANYELQKAEVDAKTAITEAKGEAEANRIKAGALNANGGEKVLAREWIQKWDGSVPTVSGGSSGFMINLSDLQKPKK